MSNLQGVSGAMGGSMGDTELEGPASLNGARLLNATLEVGVFNTTIGLRITAPELGPQPMVLTLNTIEAFGIAGALLTALQSVEAELKKQLTQVGQLINTITQ